MECEKEVKTIRVYLKCPDCDKKLLIINPLNTHSKDFTYKCTRCDYTISDKTRYPYIKYVDVNII